MTIPTSSDKLVMSVDASPVTQGISATLFVLRNERKLVAGFFSVKLKLHQLDWEPYEQEGLAITAGVKHFAPYIRESFHPLQVVIDNKSCVQAFTKLWKGRFSASARISTFLSCLCVHNVILCHLKGENNLSSDFGSRHPQECSDGSCQICKFVNETITSVVNSVSISDILSGSAHMPFLNTSAWRSAQHSCTSL